MPKEESSKVALRYVKKYPNLPDLTLAKLIYKENPILFTSIERVRSVVRYHRGHTGGKNRKSVKDKSAFKPITYNTNPFDIPESKEHKLEVFTLPKANKNILFLTDIHLPYHNIKALELALKYGKENNIDTIWLNGDTLDMFSCSFHEKNPTGATIKEEFDTCRTFLQSLRKHFPKATIYFKEGNHERRWKRYLRIKAPEVLQMQEFELPVILEFSKYGVVWIDNETLAKFGNLNVIHGNEFKGGGGVNPARALYLRAKDNCIAGDKHKTGENTEGSLNGNIVTTWAVGCLCELNPEYLPMAHVNWNHGFSHITMDGDDFHVSNLRIYKGKIL